MITINHLEIEGVLFTAVHLELPNTNVIVIANEIGYIMCAALNVDVLNENLKSHQAIAGSAAGVSTIEELLTAPIEYMTEAAKDYGWEPGIIGKEALRRIA